MGDLVLQPFLLDARFSRSSRAFSRNAMNCRTVTSVVTTTAASITTAAGPVQRAPNATAISGTSTAATAR